MISVLAKARTETTDGLWANKMGGDFEEGDPAITAFSIQGRADIKELGGHLRVFFKDIIIKRRIFVLTETIRTKMLADYYEEKKRKKQAAYGLLPDAEESDSDEDDDEEEKERKEKIIVDGLVEIEKMKALEVPKLHLYLTGKKPKVRMVDAHTHGTKLRLMGGKDVEGKFGNERQVSSYEASLTDIPDALGYQGIVVLKLPDSEPITSEPIIYAIIKLQSYRTQKVRTGDALQLTEIAETVEKVMMSKQIRLGGTTSPAKTTNNNTTANGNTDKNNKSKENPSDSTNINNKNPVEEQDVVVTKDVHDRVKPLHVYRQLTNKVWQDFQKSQSEEVDFNTFLKFLDYIDIFMVTTQAKRIFDAVDIGQDNSMGMSEFENFLIAYDILGGSNPDLIVMDVFDSLKALPTAVLAKLKEEEEKKKLKEIEEKKKELAAAAVLTKANAAVGRVREPETTTTAVAAAGGNTTTGDNQQSTEPGGKVRALREARALAEQAATLAGTKSPQKSKNLIEAGLDYSAFNEGIQLLGVKEDDDDIIREAFCFGGSIREKEADRKYLNLLEFRKAWLKLANVEVEMGNRGMKYEPGMFADSRNRERLTRAITEVENTYLINLTKISIIIDYIKKERREKKDEKRRQNEAYREKLLHEAQKFIAIRSQEKRIKLKKEQEERSKKRLEDKILKNKLLLQQQENATKERLNIIEKNQMKEKLRKNEIQSLGLDQLNYSVQQLRFIPKQLYSNQEAQMRLGYVLYADFSYNILEILPGEEFLYWLSECKVLKLAENRLKTLPVQISQLANIEIFELNNNYITTIPEELTLLTKLQRFDLSTNHIITLPIEFGNLKSLKYLKIHSNYFETLPQSIGECSKLEYIDISHNKCTELPESMQYLISLTHLDISDNRITAFPYNIGDCLNLLYINATINKIAYIPPSFSQLSKLEYCNLENNDIVLSPNCFNQLSSCKYFNMRTNAATVLHADIGSMCNLTMLDMSMNAITSLPLEIGMLRCLQELKLHRNQIITIPPELGSCVLLQRLEVPYNQLQGCLPETIGLVRSLVHLDVSFNAIEGLPRSIVGLQQLTSINAERCLMTSLPDTFTYLDRLTVLELPNNRFTRFPIELHQMKGLKTLNLANNIMALLPRNINLMTNLESLNLSRNQLRALPVEFTDILESVAVVELGHNPWSDLPPRWGKLWPDANTTEGSGGYSLSDAVDFLYGMRTFYDTAEQIWEELGVFHYTHKLCFEDFLQELRRRIPRTWHEGLVEYVKHVYFTSRQTGVFVRWYALDDATALDNALRHAANQQKRDEQVMNSRLDLARRQKHLAEVYGDDVRRRAKHVVDRVQDLQRNDDIKQQVVFRHTRKVAVKEEQISLMRQEVRERHFAELQIEEMERLKELLDADKEGREDEKKTRKQKNREPYKLSQVRMYN